MVDFIWTHAYDYSTGKAVGVDYGNYSSDPNVWVARHRYIEELVESHGGSGVVMPYDELIGKTWHRVPWHRWRFWDRWVKERKRSGEHRAMFDSVSKHP